MSTLPAGVRRLGSRLVSFFLLEEDGRATLVDAGAPGYGRQIDAEASGRIDAAVLTHAHADHVGVAEILRTELGVPVYVHEADAESARSAKATSYDDELDVPGKLRAIHTPGHTAGHCVLLSEPSGALFAGDAICTPSSPASTGRR